MWARGFGWADVERKVPATALLQLRDAGKLRLDDPVAEVLPWFKPSPADGDASPITIRQLITHTSGLPLEAPFPYWSEAVFSSVDDIRAALPS